MALNCGIVGLPNVGKSTLFSALTSQTVPIENYPFCTIEPNRGIVPVPDERLSRLSAIVGVKRTIPAVVEFVDIAGLVAGASKGEGLGNRFLSHIREVNLVVHIVRCFDDPDVVHIDGRIDPVSDIQVIATELALADLETVAKRIEKNHKGLKSDNKDVVRRLQSEQPLLERLNAHLSEGRPARSMELSAEQREIVEGLSLLTMKAQLYVCNIDEESIGAGDGYVARVQELAQAEGAACLALCCKLEAEISALESEAERSAFLGAAGLAESGLSRLVQETYRLLGLRTFFTENGEEARAWTIRNGDTAPVAAGVIHTDFQNGFIKAEVYHCEDLFSLGSVQKLREHGKLRLEGKEYVVEDGDVILFRFSVHG